MLGTKCFFCFGVESDKGSQKGEIKVCYSYSGSASWTFSRFQGKNGPLVLTLERCLMLASVQTVTRYKWVHLFLLHFIVNCQHVVTYRYSMWPFFDNQTLRPCTSTVNLQIHLPTVMHLT